MRLARVIVAAALVSAGGLARAADTAESPPPWSVTASVFGYAIPDKPNFVMVTAPADLRRLHLEGRYNYESLSTGSAFVGINSGWGEKLKLHVTPMVGGVFGRLNGIAPALRLSLTWWSLDFYSESELVIDVADVAASFFYAWSELGFSPLEWLRVGIVGQRSRVVSTTLDIQRGLLLGLSYDFITLTLYEFNIGWTVPTFVAAVSVTL